MKEIVNALLRPYNVFISRFKACDELGLSRVKALKQLEKKINYTFRDISLLNRAVTHSSYANERKLPTGHYERLEFLGDAVLELIITEYLFNNHSNLDEGRMTGMRAKLVNGEMLSRKAVMLGLGDYLLLGRGEEITGGRKKTSLLADCFESLMGAFYLDGGMPAARRFIYRIFAKEFGYKNLEMMIKDPKSLLQEFVQNRYKRLPRYVIDRVKGPEHDKVYFAQVVVCGETKGKGRGKTKKSAEQNAALMALTHFQVLDPQTMIYNDNGNFFRF